jgi:hypothetical protein
MKPKILEIFEKHNISVEYEQAESIINDIIEECIFTFLMNYQGKLNPIELKQLLDEQFGINLFYYKDE